MTTLYFVRTKCDGKPLGKFSEFDSKDEAFEYAKGKIDSDFGIEIIRQEV